MIKPPVGDPFRKRLDKELFKIGRGPENDLVLFDPYLSRSHAEIRREGESYLLVDRMSRNGTILNGLRLKEPAPL